MAPSLADLFQEMLKDLEVEREELEKEKVETDHHTTSII